MGAPGPPLDAFATATGVVVEVLAVDGGDVVDGAGTDIVEVGIVVAVRSGAVVDAGTEVVGGTVVVGATVVVVVEEVVVVVEDVVVLDVDVEGSEGAGLPPRAESTSADRDPTT